MTPCDKKLDRLLRMDQRRGAQSERAFQLSAAGGMELFE
jgi:hypothetical protein